MSDALPLLRIRNLTTHLGSRQRPVRAVAGLDLDICQGETFALLGESGCGKSMAALSVMRLLPPSGRIVDGDILFGGSSLIDLEEREMRRLRGGRMGMIFQEPMTSLNAVLTIGDQIGEAVSLRDPGSRGKVRQRVMELLRAVGIPDPERRTNEYPHQLSGGMKQRVMIAIALAGRPELLIADEPTTALDVTIQAQVLSLLKDLQRRTGMAVLLITHDLGVVSQVADRVAVMYAGQIIEMTDRQRFFDQPTHPYSQKLFHSLPGREKQGSRLDVIKGSVPPLDQEFTRCRFLERCERAGEACTERAPVWQATGTRSGVRCLLIGQAQDADGHRAHRSPAVMQSRVTEDPPLLKVNDLRVHFPIHRGLLRRVVGYVKAVDGIDLSIYKGRTLALVGESGCGKTTAGKAILQLVKPTSGSALFGGHDLVKLRAAKLRRQRADLQIIFQDPVASMNPRMLVGDIVAEGLRAQMGEGKGAVLRERVLALLNQVGLPGDAVDRYPHEFSGGQRQRICIARALAVDPGFIVCDEPTSALDVSVQAQILNLLKDLQDQQGLSYLFITHNISVVSYLAHEVAVMYLGRIVEYGTVDEVLGAPRHPYTRALLSAVPTIDARDRREVIKLEGDMPSPANPPAGCHFHPRCPHAFERCLSHYPEPVKLSATRTVSCFVVEAERETRLQ
ncbi:MAG: ABC transporter ATP-binding protein [Gammaproteobacteria bacterium]|nr:ABC transporter ATP-binding protein [Gammaproteobacteria bacterium]